MPTELTPERRAAWLARLGKPAATPPAELSDDALLDAAGGEYDAVLADVGPDGDITRQVTALSADRTRLTDELAAAQRQVLSLSGNGPAAGTHPPDPEVLRDRADNYAQRIDLMVERGDVPKAIGDNIKGMVVTAAGGPSVLMLSADPSIGNRRPVDAILALFDGAKLGVAHNNGVARAAGTAAPPQFPAVPPLSGDRAGQQQDTSDDDAKFAADYQRRQLEARGLAPAK